MLRSIIAATIAVGTLSTPLPARAELGIQVGELNCQIGRDVGLILGSREALTCRFAGIGGGASSYVGTITKFGIDIGVTEGGELVWAVFAPTSELAGGALAGRYFGVTAEATAGVGVGANVLVGGFDRSISLQPLSLQGQTGADIAAGVAEMQLDAR